MRKCEKCQADCADTAKFCPECGQPLPTKKNCPNCKADNPLDAKFCGQCGCAFTGEKPLLDQLAEAVEETAEAIAKRADELLNNPKVTGAAEAVGTFAQDMKSSLGKLANNLRNLPKKDSEEEQPK